MAEVLLKTPEVWGSNEVIRKFFIPNINLRLTVEKVKLKKKMPGMAHCKNNWPRVGDKRSRRRCFELYLNGLNSKKWHSTTRVAMGPTYIGRLVDLLIFSLFQCDVIHIWQLQKFLWKIKHLSTKDYFFVLLLKVTKQLSSV